jgi:hypothetical protein
METTRESTSREREVEGESHAIEETWTGALSFDSGNGSETAEKGISMEKRPPRPARLANLKSVVGSEWSWMFALFLFSSLLSIYHTFCLCFPS